MTAISKSSHRQMLYLIFDTETTGLPPRGAELDIPDPTFERWPNVIQLSWIIWNSATGEIVKVRDLYVRLPPERTISAGAMEKHKITPAHLTEHGVDPTEAFGEFAEDVAKSHYIVSHNLKFDMEVMQTEYRRRGETDPFTTTPKMRFCTMEHGKPLCGIKRLSMNGTPYVKPPTLTELHNFLFPDAEDAPPLTNLHNSLTDVLICCRVAVKMISGNDISKAVSGYWDHFETYAAPIPEGQH